MKLHGRYSVQVICLVLIIPLSLEKEQSLPKLITRWELEFVSLHFIQPLSKLPCSADSKVSIQLPVAVVVGYTLPNGHIGKTSLLMTPDASCFDGSLRFRPSDSPNRMTISTVNNKVCLDGAQLQMSINMRTKGDTTPTAHFNKTVYTAHNGPVWNPSLLVDRQESSLLRLNWRVFCGGSEGQHRGGELRPRRQAQDEGPAENALGDSTNATESSSVPISKSATLTAEASTSPRPGFTSGAEIVSTPGEETDTFASGEPPDSFVTGISEIFGLTKKPLSAQGFKSTHPSTATDQFSSLLRTLFGPTADVSTLLDRSSSVPVDLSSPSHTYPSFSARPRGVSVLSLAAPEGGLEGDRPPGRNGSEISAPAGGQGGSQDPDLDDPKTNPGLINATDTDSSNGTKTGVFPSSTTPSVNKTDAADEGLPTVAYDVTNSPSSHGVASQSTSPTASGEISSQGPTQTLYDTTVTTTTNTSSTTGPGVSAASDDEMVGAKSSTLPSTSKPTTTVTTAGRSTTTTSTASSTTTTTTTTAATTTSTTTTTAQRPTTPSKPVSRTRSSTRKDVIFTKAKTKPTPTYPETSNEVYMGKTGETSSAGRVEDKPGSENDADKRNEATLWPIVMGLVIGVPTIIVLSIAITVVQKKHIGVPHRHLSSPGYFERRPPPVPFVIVSKHDVSSTVI